MAKLMAGCVVMCTTFMPAGMLPAGMRQRAGLVCLLACIAILCLGRNSYGLSDAEALPRRSLKQFGKTPSHST